jgi:minor extracellular serine protease Vpr
MSLESSRASGIALNAQRELDVFIVGTASHAALEAAGARVRTELPGIVTAHVPAAAVERVAALPGVTLVRGATRLRPWLDASVPATGATPQRGPGPGFVGLNGAGVVIGTVDTGVDLDHEDFRGASGSTRVLRVWDQTDTGGPTPPGFGYGSEWTAADIDAHVAREFDEEGHGTHVLGIAGGDGSATGGTTPAFTYAGMAPQADLMVVKADFTDTAVLDGVAWVMNRAAALGKPAVVNLSLGSLFGPKDGTSPFEEGLDALTGPGRIVVVAAGNNGGSANHSEISVPANATRSTTFNVSGSAAGATVAIDGYYGAAGYVTMTLTAPNGVAYGPIALGGWNASYPGTLTPCGWLYFENGAVLTSTGAREAYVEIRVPYPNPFGVDMNGTWTLTFTQVGGAADAIAGAIPSSAARAGAGLGAQRVDSRSSTGRESGSVELASTVEVDSWIFYANVPAAFALGNRPDEELIAEPGNAERVITVGAWVTKNRWVDCGGRNVGYADTPPIGDLAWFSSPGPTRDGRQKPDIAAPGQGIASATSFDSPIACPGVACSLLGDGLKHWIYEGTSMAAPHVAGAVALLLQKHGSLDPDQVKAHLRANAVHDGFTGVTWNPRFGHGKLAVGDLTDPTVRVLYPNGGERLAQSSVVTVQWSATDAFGSVGTVDLDVARTNGGAYETIAHGVPNSGSYAWTVSGPMTTQARLKVTARDGGGNSASDFGDGLFAIAGPLEVPGGAVDDFALAIASANPSAGPVDVDFALPRVADVEITVLDLAGRRVATLARGIHAAGRHRARWTPRSERSSSGVYFVRLRAPQTMLTRRIAITR